MAQNGYDTPREPIVMSTSPRFVPSSVDRATFAVPRPVRILMTRSGRLMLLIPRAGNTATVKGTSSSRR